MSTLSSLRLACSIHDSIGKRADTREKGSTRGQTVVFPAVTSLAIWYYQFQVSAGDISDRIGLQGVRGAVPPLRPWNRSEPTAATCERWDRSRQQFCD